MLWAAKPAGKGTAGQRIPCKTACLLNDTKSVTRHSLFTPQNLRVLALLYTYEQRGSRLVCGPYFTSARPCPSHAPFPIQNFIFFLENPGKP
jgi:hypothetical protein